MFGHARVRSEKEQNLLFMTLTKKGTRISYFFWLFFLVFILFSLLSWEPVALMTTHEEPESVWITLLLSMTLSRRLLNINKYETIS